ncbi:hypothetical protein D9M68_450690 [compost metagenome]
MSIRNEQGAQPPSSRAGLQALVAQRRLLLFSLDSPDGFGRVLRGLWLGIQQSWNIPVALHDMHLLRSHSADIGEEFAQALDGLHIRAEGS